MPAIGASTTGAATSIGPRRRPVRGAVVTDTPDSLVSNSELSACERTVMRVVVVNHLSLDGVLQAPGGADEDTRDGFRHGGWAAQAGADPALGAAMGEHLVGDKAGIALLAVLPSCPPHPVERHIHEEDMQE